MWSCRRGCSADKEADIDIGAARFVGVPVLAAGCWLLLDSVFVRFAREERGTLAPIDPPRFVVRGARTGSCAIRCTSPTWRSWSDPASQSWFLFVWATVLFVAFHLFVITYEEPTLHRMFGEDYETYLRHVGRWIPRLPRPRAEAP